MDTLVVAGMPIDQGYYLEMASELTRRAVEVRAFNPPEVDWDNINRDRGMRVNCMYACWAKDAKVVVETVSRLFTGQVQVFSLSAIYSRIPGDLKQLDVTKDGVLPNA